MKNKHFYLVLLMNTNDCKWFDTEDEAWNWLSYECPNNLGWRKPIEVTVDEDRINEKVSEIFKKIYHFEKLD